MNMLAAFFLVLLLFAIAGTIFWLGMKVGENEMKAQYRKTLEQLNDIRLAWVTFSTSDAGKAYLTGKAEGWDDARNHLQNYMAAPNEPA